MSSDIVVYSLDEGARVRLFEELADVTERILRCRAQLAVDVEELAAFGLAWRDRLGELNIECARLRAEVAAAKAARHPEDEGAAHRATEAAAEADAASSEQSASPPDPERPPADPDLRALYRDVARHLHPDLAGDDPAERERRTLLMAEANVAYAARDSAALQALLDGNKTTAAGRPSSDRDLLEQVARAWRDLDAAERALGALHRSEDWLLMDEAAQLAKTGRDLLAETRLSLCAQRNALVARLAAMMAPR